MAESGQATGMGWVVVVGAGAVVDGLGDAELDDGLPGGRRRPVAGGLLDGATEASGTPSGLAFAALRTDGVSPPPSSAPTAQMNNSAPTPNPVMATTRRRRYTDGESGLVGSSTCGN
ncbi:MAG TPA: hypothetical protein VFX16_22500 [Pseudonocardiaceae bacterium]|nr:hypothetical protein [Pseudonocardiaceae bacterium]